MTPPRARHGFSLIELMISLAIMSVAIAATIAVVISLTTMTRNAEVSGDSDDRVRMAASHLEKAIESAGLLTPGGIWVNGGASAPMLTLPVFGMDGTTGAGFAAGGSAVVRADQTDELWVVVPDRNAFREGCVEAGAGVTVSRTQAGGSGPVVTSCKAAITTFATTDTLVAANGSNGALLSPPLTFGLTAAGATIDYAGSGVVGLAPAPSPGVGFGVGDLVYRVRVFHYSIKVNPQTGRPGLCRHAGVAGLEPVTGRPFVEEATGAKGDEFVIDFIEDMQIKYLFENPAAPGDPSAYLTADALPPSASPATGLRSILISLVGVGMKPEHDTSGGNAVALAPLQVENHTTVGPRDGYRRTLFVQRLELANVSPGNL